MDGRLNFKEFYKSLRKIMDLPDSDSDEDEAEDNLE